MNNLSVRPAEIRILRIKEVEIRTGFKRSYIYRLISQEKFPRNYIIGLRAVGWKSSDIDEWVEQRFDINNVK